MKTRNLAHGAVLLLVAVLFAVALGGCTRPSKTANPLPVIATTPANGETRVNVRPTIQIVLGEDVDEASLRNATVSLVGSPAYAYVIPKIRSEVSYDKAVRTITIQPARPLEWGLEYRLALVGIRDVDGNDLDSFQIQFRTFENRITRLGKYPSDGDASCMFTWNGANGQPQNYFLPGVDRVCFTDDDVVEYSDMFVYDDAGRKTRDLHFGGPGSDRLWFTVDDTLKSYISYTYRSDGSLARSISHTGKGSDGTWFTADDVVEKWWAYTPSGDGFVITETEYTSSGGDELWFTPDDFFDGYVESTYDLNGKETKQVSYSTDLQGSSWVTSYLVSTYDFYGNQTTEFLFRDEGRDGVWFTRDDDISSGRDTLFDESGQLLRFTSYLGSGTDGVWFTPDDEWWSKQTFELDPNNSQLRVTWFEGALGDSSSTTVNRAVRYERITYDRNGNPLRYENSVGPGADGFWGTEDDMIGVGHDSVGGYSDSIYDAFHNLTGYKYYLTPGADGQWFSEDDTLGFYAEIKYGDEGNRVSYIGYNEPGPDALWFTSDDRVEETREYDTQY